MPAKAGIHDTLVKKSLHKLAWMAAGVQPGPDPGRP
jgi:hypothetical protein